MWWRLLAVGVGSYALGLVTSVPATLVDAGLQRASDGRLRLAEARGTLWSGAGQFEILDPSLQSGIATGLTWRLLPMSLLRGHLVCEIKLDQQARQFPVTISPARIEIGDADLSLPAGI